MSSEKRALQPLSCSLATYYPKGRAMWVKYKVEPGQRGRAVELHGQDLDDVRTDVEPHRGGHYEGRAGAEQNHRGQERVGAGRALSHGPAVRRVGEIVDCTRKPRVRQHKDTLVAKPYHPELAAASASLVDPASARAGLKGGV